MNPDQKTDIFDILIITILCSMVVLSPLPLGSVAPWARNTWFLVALVLLSIWLIQGVWQGQLRIVRSFIWFFIIAFFCVSFIQLIPLSPNLIETLSPTAHEVYSSAISGYSESDSRKTLSLNTYESTTTIIRFFIVTTVFFIIVNSFRTRWQIITLILALITIGGFEALYGFAEQFSGHKHIFWIKRQFHLAAVIGTFHNKNHFCGLLEMIMPLSFGFLIAISGKLANRSKQRGNNLPWRVRFFYRVSSQRLYKQLMLGLLTIIMFVGIFFSLSRAGIISTFISLLIMGGLVAFTAGIRFYTIVLTAIIAGLLAISMSIGMDLVIDGLEDAVSGQALSWLARLDLLKSAIEYIKDFWLSGSGIGTFGVVFPRYQSPYFGDQWADYLHNDWVQLVCEVGIFGTLIVVIGITLVFLTIAHQIIVRKDTFSKWVAMGGCSGILVMMLHSCFDYNLYKITSNGIIFAIISGLSFTGAHLPGANKQSKSRLTYLTVPLGSKSIKLVVIVLAIAIIISRNYMPTSSILADIYYNDYLAGEEIHKDYFFLKSDTTKHKDSSLLDKASKLDPLNTAIMYRRAMRSIKIADKLISEAAVQKAKDLLGIELQKKDPIGFQNISAALEENLKITMYPVREQYLRSAEKLLHQAIDAAPTWPKYQIILAKINLELGQDTTEISRWIDNAVKLAPNKANTQSNAGSIYLQLCFQEAKNVGIEDLMANLVDSIDLKFQPDNPGSNYHQVYLNKAFESFRRAILSDPSYARQIYNLIKSTIDSPDVLFYVTPSTIKAHEKLYRHLKNSGDWPQVLKCLQAMEKLAEARNDVDQSIQPGWYSYLPGAKKFEINTSESFGSGAIGYDRRDPRIIKYSILQRYNSALEVLGRWGDRREIVPKIQELSKDSINKDFTEAQRLRQLGRSKEALEICLKILQKDWANSDVLLAAAELSTLPNILDYFPPWNEPLDHLYRLITYNTPSLYPDAASLQSVAQHLGNKNPASTKVNSSIKTLRPPNEAINRSTLISQSNYQRIITILDSLHLEENPAGITVAEFIRSTAALLSGKTQDGMTKLKSLTVRNDNVFDIWRQKHLVWYYLGFGHELLNENEKAILAYKKVIEIVPEHLPACLRLYFLGNRNTLNNSIYANTKIIEQPDNSSDGNNHTEIQESSLDLAKSESGILNEPNENIDSNNVNSVLALATSEVTPSVNFEKSMQPNIEDLLPDTPICVNYGGKMSLIGYHLGKEIVVKFMKSVAIPQEKWFITSYWQFHDRLPKGAKPYFQFCNKNWRSQYSKTGPITVNGKTYPIDLARSGELVINKHVLSSKIIDLPYLRIGIKSPSLVSGSYLLTDNRQTWLTTNPHIAK